MVTIGSGPIVATAVESIVGKKVSLTMVSGVAVALVGLSILVLGSSAGAGKEISIQGIMSGVGAGACYAAYTHISKRLLTLGWSGAWVMAQSFSVSALVCSPLLFTVPMQWLSSTQSVIAVVYLGIATIAIPYLLYALSLARLTSAVVVTLTLIEPVTATALGAFFLNENITIVSWMGAAIVVLGLIYTGMTSERHQETVL